MIKLRKPFSQKVQLHIRQNILQQLWDKYVPTSSPEYKKIELIYLKGGPEELEKQPERIQLLLHLILKNKMLQLNLMRQPAVMKLGQKQMENSLQRMERYYTVQLKSADPAMYRTVRQYFTLLEQVGEDDRRYQNWQKTNQTIEKQKEEYRLLSLFSEKLRERLTVHSISTMRMMERDFVNSLTETEYQMLAEELIWQEKPELIAYFNEWDESQCEHMITELEREIDQNSDIQQILSQVSSQSLKEKWKEKLITAVEKFGQKEFCLFYHQLTDLETVNPQVILWRESRAKMLHTIDQMDLETLQQLQRQIENLINPLEQDPSQVQEDDSYVQDILQTQDDEGLDQELLRTLERELVYSLSETEYQTLSEKNIWQEKPELIAYLRKCEQVPCMEIVRELEKDVRMREILSLYSEQPAKERLITAAEKLEQKEFCLFYHQVMKREDIAPQIVLWKESRAEMLYFIDQMESKALQQAWEQIERAEHQSESDTLRAYEKDVQSQETLRTQEKELLDSLLETEYQTLAERLIWQEKPELIAYFRELEKARCKEIIKQLEKDTRMRRVLAAIQKQSAKKKLIAAAYQLEQSEFRSFYWQIVEFLNVNPQIVIWKKSRAEMSRSIDDLGSGGLQQVWEQMQAVEPVQGLKQVFARKMRSLQNQYQQNTSENLQEQIAVLMEESDLAGVADLIDPEQLVQDHDRAEETENSVDVIQEPLSGYGEREQLVLWDGAYQVIQNLEHEQKMRRERIEQQQMQAAKAYQEIYHQIFKTEASTMQQDAERIFREQHQEQLTEEEIQNICEWSQAFLEVYLTQQGWAVNDRDFPEEGSFSSDQWNQIEQLELTHLIQKMDQYIVDHDIEKQYGTGERLILRRQEALSKDERIQKLLIYMRELEEQQKEQLIHALAEMVWMSVQLSSQKRENTSPAVLPMQGSQQRSVERLLQTEDMEFAQKLLQLEDREFAQRILWLEDRELAERLLQTEDREFAERLLQIEDRELARGLLQIEDRELVERLLQIEDRELAKRLVQIKDKEIAGKLLQIEDKEFVKRLLQIEDREFVRRLLQIEDREIAERLLQIEDREIARKLLQTENEESVSQLSQDSNGQLLEISYRSLWEWGETLLFHPEQEPEQEDADVLSFSRQETNFSDTDEAQQADVQTQMIRRQIEMAKDRNRLQSLIRQINHQADIQLVYTDAQLRSPQIQTLLQYVQQLDEKQYGVLVKELAQITQLQKLSYEEPKAQAIVAQTADEEKYSSIEETNAIVLHNKIDYTGQLRQDNAYEPVQNQLRIEDKKFIEKLLQVEDREFAGRLLQVENRELAEKLLRVEDRDFVEKLLQLKNEDFVEKLLQIEDRKFAEKLLQIENKDLAGRLLQIEDRELAEKLLQIENKDFVERLLQIEDRELAGKLLQIENKDFAERLLRIGDKEVVWKLLRDNDGQSQEVSYRTMWEWGEALLLHPENQLERDSDDSISSPQQEVSASDYNDVQKADGQTQMAHQRNHLQSLIGQINHQADVQLTYTDAQLRMPQVQALLQYVRQLDVKQYGAFVRELAQVMMAQKLSYDNIEMLPAAVAEVEKTPFAPYQTLVQYIQNYEKQRQLILYRDIRKIEQKILPQTYRKEESALLFDETGINANGLTLDETGINANGQISYEIKINANSQAPYETGINTDGRALYETDINVNGLTPYEISSHIYDLMPNEESEKEYEQITPYDRSHQESSYQPRELEYSTQAASVSEEDQQRRELRMQQETAQLKSVQEQLDKKLKDVEQQLKKVEDSTKAKEDVRTFAEQVKRQLYEELHVEKLRRGLI